MNAASQAIGHRQLRVASAPRRSTTQAAAAPSRARLAFRSDAISKSGGAHGYRRYAAVRGATFPSDHAYAELADALSTRIGRRSARYAMTTAAEEATASRV